MLLSITTLKNVVKASNSNQDVEKEFEPMAIEVS